METDLVHHSSVPSMWDNFPMIKINSGVGFNGNPKHSCLNVYTQCLC